MRQAKSARIFQHGGRRQGCDYARHKSNDKHACRPNWSDRPTHPDHQDGDEHQAASLPLNGFTASVTRSIMTFSFGSAARKRPTS